jgi:WhiB family redox-sensing transcriptional regulator
MGYQAPSRYSPDTITPPPHWSKDAACLGAPPDLFHPEGDTATVLACTAEAKRYCARCSVRDQCLLDSLARGERFGVFGGLDERERRAILRRQRERDRAARNRADRQREEAAGATPETAAAPAA